MVKRKIIWDTKAVESLKEIYLYIKKESPQGAEKVRSEIFEIVNKLPAHPEIFAADRLKINNDGSFRAFHIYSYRIAYKINDDNIVILRIRHSSREPEDY